MEFLKQIYPTVEAINTWTSPIGFLITLFTFLFAFNTQRKIEETKEILLFNDDIDGYLSRLQGIKMLLDSIENREGVVPEKVILEVIKIASESRGRYPTLMRWHPEIRRPIKKIKKFKRQEKVTIIEFIDPFNDFCNLFYTRKEFPK